ncbi:MAG: hypothetical protein M5R37_09345 [Melioribacteraceae bacterium]|nr:hypothetical protein [Melioribacteraceae bacterium]
MSELIRFTTELNYQFRVDHDSPLNNLFKTTQLGSEFVPDPREIIKKKLKKGEQHAKTYHA